MCFALIIVLIVLIYLLYIHTHTYVCTLMDHMFTIKLAGASALFSVHITYILYHVQYALVVSQCVYLYLLIHFIAILLAFEHDWRCISSSRFNYYETIFSHSILLFHFLMSVTMFLLLIDCFL